MKTKQIITSEYSTKNIVSVVNKVADIVGITMGAKGRNVLITNELGQVKPTKDGYSITESIFFKDKSEQSIVEMIKEGSKRVNDDAGDSTTAYIVLIRGIINEGIKNIAAGSSPLAIKRGIDKGTKYIIESLRKSSKKITSEKQIKEIASVSANDNEIGSIIADATKKVGKEGFITIEKGDAFETTNEIVQGLSFDRGFVSPYMAKELDNPYILLTDKKIDSYASIKTLLEKVAHSDNKDLLIIADDITGDGITVLVINKMAGALNPLAVRSPGFIDKNELLEDMAVLTGAKIVSEQTGISLEEVSLEDLGTAKKVISSRDTTTIIGGAGSKTAINKRKRLIRLKIKESTDNTEKKLLQARLSKLSGGIGIIKVGGSTEAEMLEKRDRIEDSLNSSKSAIEQGIVIGGGMALIRASDGIDSLNLPNDELLGVNILLETIKRPFKQIIENAGESGDVYLAEVLKNRKTFGYNVKTGKVEDMFKSGIVDPTKAIISSLKHATSIGSMLLTLGGLIVEDKENVPEKQSGPHQPLN